MTNLSAADRALLGQGFATGSLLAVTRIDGVLCPEGEQRLRELMMLAIRGFLRISLEDSGGQGDWTYAYKLTEAGEAVLQER